MKCCCLTCGFCEAGKDRDGIACANRQSHDNSCEKCAGSFSIIEDLKVLHSAKEAGLVARGGSTKERQELQNLKAAIDAIASDLAEYRGHLARHKSEGDHDTEELGKLEDDTAVIISDYKMKILSCFFRENQLKFFGKRGTSCLGFMIITNSEDPEVRAKGVKEVKFVMLFTDDSQQDELSIASAKYEIYKHHLPPQISKVHFHSDGAGAFKSGYHIVMFCFYKWLQL